jgi:hypothetical protein
MHAGQTPLHYAPASVGALMDPGFLRGAVLDADGGVRTLPVKPRWHKRTSDIWRALIARVFRR